MLAFARMLILVAAGALAAALAAAQADTGAAGSSGAVERDEAPAFFIFKQKREDAEPSKAWREKIGRAHV